MRICQLILGMSLIFGCGTEIRDHSPVDPAEQDSSAEATVESSRSDPTAADSVAETTSESESESASEPSSEPSVLLYPERYQSWLS
jgi:hypothetical protein